MPRTPIVLMPGVNALRVRMGWGILPVVGVVVVGFRSRVIVGGQATG